MTADAPAQTNDKTNDKTADKTTGNPVPFVVAAFYAFCSLPDYKAQQAPLLQVCRDAGVCGTVLLAPEGVNGTIAGSRHGIDAVLDAIKQMLGRDTLEIKESFALEAPFYRMKVRLKKEIVTMGVEGIDPNRSVGTYVAPEDWNALIADPDVIVIDTRNDYEVGIGTFRGAIDPKTTSFSAFPDWFQNHEELRAEAVQGKKIAMFCTGGIRCEKATAFVKQQGIDQVYHLKGGILKYLETVPEAESLWDGECFVFDQRVAVKHDLALGSYALCRACRKPINEADKASDKYVEGVSCPHCFDATDAKSKQRFLERQRQMELAEARGETHMGQHYPQPSKADAVDG